jgi:Holliday junction resolvase RusA-like endonuclease
MMKTAYEFLSKMAPVTDAGEVRIVLPGQLPPSVNDYKSMDWRTQRHFVKDEARVFKRDVGHLALGRSIKALKYAIALDFYLDKFRRSDLDNFNKVTLDALQAAGVIANDKDVKLLLSLKHTDQPDNKTEITVREYVDSEKN